MKNINGYKLTSLEFALYEDEIVYGGKIYELEKDPTKIDIWLVKNDAGVYEEVQVNIAPKYPSFNRTRNCLHCGG